MTSKPDDVFELEKNANLNDLLSQIELISKEFKEWTDKIISTNNIARQNSKSDINDTFHNFCQNIIALSKLILKKLKEV